MPFLPPTPEKERQCIFGHAGAGKTSYVIELFDILQATEFTGKAYVLDTWGEYEGFDYPFMTTFPCMNYGECEAIADMAIADLAPGDFFIADKWDLWDYAQDRYYNGKGETRTEYLMRQTIEHKERGVNPGGKGFDQWREVNWSVVNGYAAEVTVPLITKCKAHIILICEQDKFNPTAETDQYVIDTYAEHRVKPRTQKKMAYQARTILWLKKQGSQHTVRTIKEGVRKIRRPYLKDEPYVNLAETYLMNTAGWQLEV